MEREEIRQKVLAMVHEQKTIAEDALTPETPLTEVGIDSLDALNILFSVEEAFDISVPDDQAREMKTVDDIVEGIERLTAEQKT